MHFLLLAAEAAAGAAPEADPRLLGLDAEGWVYAGITIFFLIAIFGAKAHRQLLAGLDARIADTRKALDEAAALRAEAEAVLGEAKARLAASAKDAAAMLDHAKAEATAIVAKAEADTSEMIARREKMASDKIEAAERGAIADLRAKAAEAATGAARGLIKAKHDAKADKALIDEAIAGI